MIVAAIIGLLAVIAIPNLARSRATTQLNVCINNMRQIDYAKQQWAIEQNRATSETPSPSDVSPYIRGGFPICPLGGSYAMGNIAASPSCNVHGTY
jgi:type II secretory pathway pseudopilin PulG